MKNLKYLILIVLMMPTLVFASSANINVATSVENGSNVTATLVLSGVAAWDAEFRGSGNTNGCYTHDVDDSGTGHNTNKSISITCRATAEGSITFSASGDMTSEDGNNQPIVTTRTVTVTKQRNGNASLSSLTVSNANINFNAGTTNYRVVVDNSVTSVNVNASAQEGTSRVQGTGTKELNVYDNIINVTCVAENGASRTYTINVIRKDEAGNDHVLSENNNLSNLEIEGYPITFTNNIKEYTLLVKSRDILKINATVEDPTAKVNIKNVEQMINGNNQIIVEVSSESGKVQEYTINAVLLDETAKCECPKPKCDKSKDRIIEIVLASILGLVVLCFIVFIVKNGKKDPESKAKKKEEKRLKKEAKKSSKKDEEE